MKKIFLSLIAVMATMSINAQIVKVYVNGSLSGTYTNSPTQTFKVVFEEASETGSTQEYVDLGLPSGTLWATHNIGATSPEEYGKYYAWADLSDDDYFSITTYKWGNGVSRSVTKYCTNNKYGYVDNKTEVEPADDIATVLWGSDWQTPSYDQIHELRNSDNVTNTWLTLNGVSGILITSKTNGNTIFLPAAGYGSYAHHYRVGIEACYWSRTLDSDYPLNAYFYGFDSSLTNPSYVGITGREAGHSVRPVRVKASEQ